MSSFWETMTGFLIYNLHVYVVKKYGIMSSSIDKSSYIVHGTCIKITEWGAFFGLSTCMYNVYMQFVQFLGIKNTLNGIINLVHMPITVISFCVIMTASWHLFQYIYIIYICIYIYIWIFYSLLTDTQFFVLCHILYLQVEKNMIAVTIFLLFTNTT